MRRYACTLNDVAVGRLSVRELLCGDWFSSPAEPRLSTTFTLPGSGLNFGGMDSQVLRPITTAFCLDGSAVLVVSSLKYAMSPGNFQGIVPPLPIPSFLVAATTI